MIGLGVLYAVLSTFSFSINQVSVRRGMLAGSAIQGVYVSVLAGTPILLLIALATTQLFRVSDLSGTSYAWLAAAGVAHFLFGRYTNYRTVGALGAIRARPIIQMSFLVSIGFAALWLKEEITTPMWLGIGLVAVGPMVLYRGRRRSAPVAPTSVPGQRSPPPVVQPGSFMEPPRAKVIEGYFFGSLNAVVFGLTPLMVRQGLEDSEGLGVLGALVAYSAAAAVLLPTLAMPAVRRALAEIDRSSGRWFMSATMAVLMAQMFHFLALSVAPVSVVMPVQRAGSVFLLPMSFLINRQTESFEPRVLIAIAISITGSLIIVL